MTESGIKIILDYRRFCLEKKMFLIYNLFSLPDIMGKCLPNENQFQRFISILDYRIKIENSKDGRNTLQSKKIIFFPKQSVTISLKPPKK